jgi:hypothetical protein
MLLNHRSMSIQSRLAKLAQEKEEEAQKLQESLSRRQTAIAFQQELFRPSTCPRRNGAAGSYNSTADETAIWRRERMAQRAADSKQIVSEFKKQQQEFERNLNERKEQAKDIAKVSCTSVVPARELMLLRCPFVHLLLEDQLHAIVCGYLMLIVIFHKVLGGCCDARL